MLALPGSGAAAAQLQATAAVDSDYQWQGLSLSNGEPVASVGLAADWPGGAYGGVTAIGGATDHDGPRPLAYVADFGYARRIGRGASWDAGVVASGGQLYLGRRYAFTYAQVYAGVSKDGLSARLFYSPSYLGEGAAALYLDVEGALHPAPGWRLVGHVGAFTTLRRQPGEPADRQRVDLRAGVVRELGHFEARLIWTTTTPAPAYPTGDRPPRRAILLGASYTF